MNFVSITLNAIKKTICQDKQWQLCRKVNLITLSIFVYISQYIINYKNNTKPYIQKKKKKKEKRMKSQCRKLDQVNVNPEIIFFRIEPRICESIQFFMTSTSQENNRIVTTILFKNSNETGVVQLDQLLQKVPVHSY